MPGSLLPDAEIDHDRLGEALNGTPSLATSIHEAIGVGQITPLVVDAAQGLVGGRGRRLEAEEANRDYGVDGHLTFDGPVFERDAARKQAGAQRRAWSEDVLGRSDMPVLGKIGLSIGGAMIDPVALPLFFAPEILGLRAGVEGALATRGVGLLAKSGRLANGTRGAIAGAVEGAVGTAIYEAPNYGLRRYSGEDDYDLGDSLSNLLLGTVLGGAIGGGIGAVLGDTRPRAVREMGDEGRVGAAAVSIDRAIDDGTIDVARMMDRETGAVSADGVVATGAISDVADLDGAAVASFTHAEREADLAGAQALAALRDDMPDLDLSPGPAAAAGDPLAAVLDEQAGKFARGEAFPAEAERVSPPKEPTEDLPNIAPARAGKSHAELAAMAKTNVETIRAQLEEMKAAAEGGRKLTDTRGQGVQFHGAREPVSNLTEGYYNPDNIYGGYDTFYTTDATDVAKGYGRKNPNSVIYKVSEKQPVRFFDMEEARAPEDWHELLGVKAGDDMSFAGEALDEVAKANGGQANLRQIMDEMRGLGREWDYDKHEVQEIFDGIAYRLQQDGYGGMRHLGGLKTNRAPHEVKIYLRPHEQLDLALTEAARDALDPAAAAQIAEMEKGLGAAEKAAAGTERAAAAEAEAMKLVDPELRALIEKDLGEAAPGVLPKNDPAIISEAIRAAAFCLSEAL